MSALRTTAGSLLALTLLGVVGQGCSSGGSSSAGTGPFSSSAAATSGTSPTTTTTVPGATTTGTTSAGSTPSGTSGTSGTTPTPAPAPTPAPTPAPAPGPTYIVSGWEPYWTYTAGDAAISANTSNGLDEVNTFGIGIAPDGHLVKRSGVEDPTRIALIRSRAGEVIPTIYDVDDGTALESVLANPAYTARCITDMVALLDAGGYDGLDIDFEHAKSSNRAAFSQFVTDLGAQVHARGKVFSVTVPGKRQDTPSWAGYDYAALGAAADRFKIMTYGYSGPWSSAPGPIAPTDWIRRVLDYAVTVVPASKIQIGIPFYGYDWPANGGTVRSVTYPRAQTLLARSPGGVVYEPTRGEAHFTYTDDSGVSHTVWFSEARSVAAKAALVKQYGLRGLSIWALGYGDVSLWDAIRAELKP